MTQNMILIIDYRPDHLRVALVDETLTVVKQAGKSLTVTVDAQKQLSVNPSAVLVTCKGLIARLLKSDTVGAIGIVSTGEVALAWHQAGGLPIEPALVHAPTATANALRKLRNLRMIDHIVDTLGKPPDESSALLKWMVLFQKYSGVREALLKSTALFGTMESWLIYQLTGGQTHITDSTHAMVSGLAHPVGCQWDTELLQALEWELSWFAQIQGPSGFFGQTQGFDVLPDGIPILSVMHRNAAICYGNQVTNFGEAGIYVSDVSRLSVHCGTQHTIRAAQWQLENAVYFEDPRFILSRNLPFPTAALNWITSSQLTPETSEWEALVKGTDDTHDVAIIPNISVNGSKQDAHAASIIGLNAHTASAQLARAFNECAAFMLKSAQDEIMDVIGASFREIHCSGPWSKNKGLMQLLSDIFQLPVVRYKSGGIIQAVAFVAGLLAGHFKTSGQFKSLRKVDRRFVPNMDPITAVTLYKTWKAKWPKQ